MADTPKHSVSVAGIVVDDQERVLVIKRRDNGHWEPPGGVLELDETPEEGVAREVWEETGLEITPKRLTGVYKNISRAVVALVFKCEVVGGKLSISDEADDIQWQQLDELRELMDEAYLIRIADALELDVKVRSHDGVNVLAP